MSSIRFMTYNIRFCRGQDGRTDPERIAGVIEEATPDLVALQEVDDTGSGGQLTYLSKRLNFKGYGFSDRHGNAFLSRFPLKGVQQYHLGWDGWCLRGDLDVHGCRIHLFNVRLDPLPGRRHRQLITLMGPDIMGQRSVVCSVILAGDFADSGWMRWLPGRDPALHPARGPLWGATFPARCPLLCRDRVYLRGDLHAEDSRVVRSLLARSASPHLPKVHNLQLSDRRSYLRLKEIKRSRMEIAPG